MKPSDIIKGIQPETNKEITRAIDWLLNWYMQRSKMKKTNGERYLTEAEMCLINDRLNDAMVVLSKYPYYDFYQGIKEGKYHLLGTKENGFANLSETELKEMSAGYVGVHFRNIKEPVLFINPDELFDANLHWEKNAGRQVWGTLGKIVVHEATHLAVKETRHEFLLQEYMGSRIRLHSDNDVDSPFEIYARINELRYDLGVKPDHIFTIEEIKALRLYLKNNLIDYKREVKSNGLDTYHKLEDLPFEGRPTDPRLFERYSDEEIVDFLNHTACRNVKLLDDEHLMNGIETHDTFTANLSKDHRLGNEQTKERHQSQIRSI